MPRNLNERVELLVPVEYSPHKERIKNILNVYFNDNVKAYAMNADGTYRYLADTRTGKPIHAQEMLQHEAEEKNMERKKKRK